MSSITLTAPRTNDTSWEEDLAAIRHKVSKIRDGWTAEESDRRAAIGEARREQLLELVTGAELELACA